MGFFFFLGPVGTPYLECKGEGVTQSSSLYIQLGELEVYQENPNMHMENM